MQFSVIVPFRDAEAYLERCITSLLAQTYPAERFEVILVDNGSTDGSPGIARGYPSVRLLSEPTPGSYLARNRGVREARGHILAFTDSDCAPRPDWLQVIAATFRDNPTVSIVQGDRDFESSSPLLRLLSVYDSEKAAFTLSGPDTDVYYAFAGNLAVRREVFDELGLFRTMLRGADVVLLQDAVRRYSGDTVVHCPEARVDHLEITNAHRWFRKMFVYGRSYEGYKTAAPCRPLNGRERLEVARRVARRQSLLGLALLAPSLACGLLCYEAGRLAGRKREDAPSPLDKPSQAESWPDKPH